MNVKNGLELCQDHKQECNQSHFDKHNCDFCKLEAEVERLRGELELSKANVQSLKKALFEVQEAAIRLGDRLDDAEKELARSQSLLDETRTELSICGAFHTVAKKEWQLEVEKVNRLETELADLEKRYDEEIGSYEDQDPRSMGWVGSDGLP